MQPAAVIAGLKGIREPTIRRKVLAEALAQGDPSAWVDALAHVLARAIGSADGDARAAVDTLAHAVGDAALGYDARQTLYAAARRHGHSALARLFLDASPPTATDEEVARQMSPERPLRPRGRPLSLGERKSLARTHARDFILLLVRDPHPDVVAVLLENPHLTEDDVVRMAALRPTVPTALLTIADHARWSTRYAVRRALVLNPWTPLHMAVRLATTLRPRDLEALAADATAPIAVRQHAAELLVAGRRRAAAVS